MNRVHPNPPQASRRDRGPFRKMIGILASRFQYRVAYNLRIARISILLLVVNLLMYQTFSELSAGKKTRANYSFRSSQISVWTCHFSGEMHFMLTADS